ncbi:MAG: hypothetical protein PHQ43_07990 [Dehalococcoidales bacterium]|nr:hypothetical protein [Dehalococcoidales bacterium]
MEMRSNVRIAESRLNGFLSGEEGWPNVKGFFELMNFFLLNDYILSRDDAGLN